MNDARRMGNGEATTHLKYDIYDSGYGKRSFAGKEFLAVSRPTINPSRESKRRRRCARNRGPPRCSRAREAPRTPNRGVFDKLLVDSDVERLFSKTADNDPEVVCFIKLPAWYQIKTPIGDYEPDFGLVMKRKSLKSGSEGEFSFVIETKGTNDINDKKALTESEVYKILVQ